LENRVGEDEFNLNNAENLMIWNKEYANCLLKMGIVNIRKYEKTKPKREPRTTRI